MSIADRLDGIRSTLPNGVRLVAVSKFHPIESIVEAYDAGQRLFGESRVQELLNKQPVLPNDIEWHFIGHLQTNKVKHVAPFVALIHGVDSEGLLAEINKQGEKCGRVIRCLIQVHIAREETKFGFSVDECRDLFASGLIAKYPFIEICGLMGMATFTDNITQIKEEFGTLSSLFTEIKTSCSKEFPHFTELSMGMSDDYPIAVELGSTMVRVGSKIFGVRQ
ncbi:YggS family pyridoxal phosphate-dependent enzyme [Porphyromonadaceae bacterium]